MLLTLLPEWVANLLTPISLIAIGYAVEKHYVSRITCFTNSIALAVHLIAFDMAGGLIGVYADVGLLLGVVGFLAYLDETSLPQIYYETSHIAYSSLIIGSIILHPYLNYYTSIPFEFLIFPIFLLNLVLLDDKENLIYDRAARVGEYDGISRLVNEYEITTYNKYGEIVQVPLKEFFK